MTRSPDPPRGLALLHDPVWNKGTAFTAAERDALGLRGLLPPRVSTPAEQQERILGNLRRKRTDLEKYIFLAGLQDRNETAYYRTVIDHITEMMPIIYTPTVGEACRRFAHIFRRPRGLFVTVEDRGRIRDILANWPTRDVAVIVVTDGERILGLGDLGASGMGIPIGKLALYTACAGVPPGRCLPITLDVGTDNTEMRDDPLYFGLSRPRCRGEEYDDLLDEFMEAVTDAFPGVLVQFEDFATPNAVRLLERYRDRYCCFNDDIQGTAAVTVAGMHAAARITGVAFAEQTVLFHGAGSAAVGIADLIVTALEGAGVDAAAARQQCWFVDSRGLVVASRDDLAPHKRPYAHDAPPESDLAATVELVRPTTLVGVSGQAGQFTEPVVRAMAAVNDRPVIFALSNPTSQAECTPTEAYRWSDGRAVYASGSPFGPVEVAGTTFHPGQGNNVYIFPGVGMGVVLAGARRVTDPMFLAAAETLAGMVDETMLKQGSIFPPLTAIRDVSAHIAARVMAVAVEEGHSPRPTPPHPDDRLALVRAHMYDATTASLV